MGTDARFVQSCGVVALRPTLFLCRRPAAGFARCAGSRLAKGNRYRSDIWRCFTISGKKELELNEQIRDREVRVTDASGAQLGIMSSAQANAMAEEQGMDLVKISPNATPPVCKIMDYSKFCFDQKKREKEAKKNQRVVEIKEIRMSPSIDTNDFNTKVKAAQKFLNDGNRVKVSVRFRGREMAHTNLGEKLLMDFAASCSEIAGMEKNPKLEGRFMAMFLTPKNSK